MFLDADRHIERRTWIFRLELGTSIPLDFRDYLCSEGATDDFDFILWCTCTSFVSREAIVSDSYTF